MALADVSLTALRSDIRQLTGNPSQAQVTDAQIDQFINRFVAYDFPNHLRTFDLHSTMTFWLSPNIDTYPTANLAPNDPLFNFKNLYINIEQPVYIGGYNSLYTQQPQELFTQYPNVRTIASIGVTGNGSTMTFTGNLNNIGSTGGSNTPITKSPILQSTVNIPAVGVGEPNQYNWGMVLFNSVDAFNNPLNMVDVPVAAPFVRPQPQYSLPPGLIPGITTTVMSPPGLTTNGNWGILFNPQPGPSSWDGTSFINYLTGQYSVTFSDIFGSPTAPQMGATINSQTYPYVPSRPQIMMYYDDMFVFRPVPDQAYPVTFEVYQRPTQLIQSAQVPDIEQWWEYISIGSAIKLLQRRRDFDTVNLLMPMFLEQQALVLRKTIVQQTTQRTSTIYVQTNGMFGYGNGWQYNGF